MRKSKLPPGLATAISLSKRLTRELQLLQHDCESAIASGTRADLDLVSERNWMALRQYHALQQPLDQVFEAIKSASEARRALDARAIPAEATR